MYICVFAFVILLENLRAPVGLQWSCHVVSKWKKTKNAKKKLNIFGAFASPGTILGGCWREKVVSDFGFCFMLHNCPLDFAQSNTSWQLLLLRLLLLELDWHASATAANETSLYCSCYPPSCCYSGGETMQFKEADNTMRGVWIVKAGYSSNMFWNGFRMSVL